MQRAQRRNPLLVPVHPILFALYAVLFVYSENLSYVIDSDVRYVLLASLGIALVVWGVVYLVVRERHRSALMASLVLFAFFGYGHLANLVSGTIESANHAVLTPVVLLVVALGMILIARKTKVGSLQPMTLFANIVALVLIVAPAFRVVQYNVRSLASTSVASANTAGTSANAGIADRDRVLNDAEHPDIYYIILDGYPSNQFLMRNWDYDNSDFTEALEERGFFVAEDSTANYAATLASLPSALNMRYMEPAEKRPTPAEDVQYLRQLIADSAVARSLIERGYSYIHIMSGYGVASQIADANIDVYPDGPRRYTGTDSQSMSCATQNLCSQMSFVPFFLKTTLLAPIVDTPIASALLARFEQEAEWSGDKPLDWSSPHRALAIWDEVEQIPAIEEATFTIAHIIKPHEPVSLTRPATLFVQMDGTAGLNN